jgi:flavodoxin
MSEKILVAYATRAGSTGEVAQAVSRRRSARRAWMWTFSGPEKWPM